MTVIVASGTTGDTPLTAAAAATSWLGIPQGAEARVIVRGDTWVGTIQLQIRRDDSQSTPDVVDSYTAKAVEALAPGPACQARLYVSALTSQTDLSGEIVIGG